jgi:hypothetical protein
VKKINLYAIWGIFSPIIFFIIAVFMLGIAQKTKYAVGFIVAILTGCIYLSMYFCENIKNLKTELQEKTKYISDLEGNTRELNHLICDSYYDVNFLIEGMKEFKDNKLTEYDLEERVRIVEKLQKKIKNKQGFEEGYDN